MRVCVFGAGYVGLVSGVGLAHMGHQVAIVDAVAERIENLRAGRVPFLEPGLEDLLRAGAAAGRIQFPESPGAGLAGSDISLIAVGTPSENGAIDLRYVLAAANTIGRWLPSADRWHTVVVKSTVVPGTTDGPVREELERASGLKAGDDFGLAINPEFLREGCAVKDFLEPDRLVFGSSEERAIGVLERLYGAMSCAKIQVAPVNAELIKYASNALLATLVSFSNEWAAICEGLPGADVETLMRGVHLDRRLSRSDDGSPIHPGILSYLAAGPGYGGSCLPKDLTAARASARSRGVSTPLLDAVAEVNRQRPAGVVEILRRELGTLEDRRIAVLGLAFKPGTDDIRESPALPLLGLLRSAGAQPRVWDPCAPSDGAASQRFATPQAVLEGADAAVLVTAWPEIAGWPWPELVTRMRGRTVLDTRNALRGVAWPAGVRYVPIGKGPDPS